MTIEEAKEIIRKRQEKINSGQCSISMKEAEDNITANLIIQGYEAKEAELDGALVIPKGLKVVEHGKNQAHYTGSTDLPKYLVTIKTPSQFRIYGTGGDYDSAFENALEQIEGGEGE